MRLTRQEVGRRGEEHAQRWLEALGFRIVDVNVRFGRMGELDIIAWDGPTLCFVEVKTRTVARPDADLAADIAPAEAVTLAKQQQIATLASRYAIQCGLAEEDDGPPFRFDVVAVTLTRQGQVRHADLCRGAFLAPEPAEN